MSKWICSSCGQEFEAHDFPENSAEHVLRQLHMLAQWFDDPKRSPLVRTDKGTPGTLLRGISIELVKTLASAQSQPGDDPMRPYD